MNQIPKHMPIDGVFADRMNSGLDWIGSVIWWIGFDWILKNGPTDISELTVKSQWWTW